MNILLVDDDRFILEGLARGIEWDRLPFTSRYEARNAVQAKAVIEQVDIHVIVCDIEMPGDSGLDLLQWIREKDYPIEMVFLTSHPDFEYARRALSLGSFEYLLKPIEYEKLTEVLEKTAQKAEETLIRRNYFSYRNAEDEQEQERKADFFRHLLVSYLPRTNDQLEKDIQQARLDYSLSDRFILFVVCFPGSDHLNWRDDGQIYYLLQTEIPKSLQRYMDETDDHTLSTETIWKENVNLWAGIVKVDRETENIWYMLGKTLSDCRKTFSKLQIDFSAYISETTTPDTLSDQWMNIRKMLFDHIAFRSGIFFANSFQTQPEYDDVILKKDLIEAAFEQENQEQLSQLIDSFIEELSTRPGAGILIIQKTVMDWQQIVFRYLEQNQIKAETLYANDEYISLYQRIDRSLEDYRSFLRYLVRSAINRARQLKDSDTMIYILKQYIDENLAGDLSRTALANVVFLNGDYMATCFKKKTGVSVKHYVYEKRMNRAKELLQFSTEPIYSIALKVGYPSASYFTKQFKAFYGKEPNEFRKRS